mgnify:CR=1 FL=1
MSPKNKIKKEKSYLKIKIGLFIKSFTHNTILKVAGIDLLHLFALFCIFFLFWFLGAGIIQSFVPYIPLIVAMRSAIIGGEKTTFVNQNLDQMVEAGTLIKTILIKIILLALLLYLIYILLFTFTKSWGWRILAKKRHSTPFFKKFFFIKLILTSLLITSYILLFNPLTVKAYASFIILSFTLYLYFSLILFANLTETETLWKNIKKIYTHGILKAHYYLIAFIIAIIFLIIGYTIISIITTTYQILGSILFFIFILYYGAWMKNYFKQISIHHQGSK